MAFRLASLFVDIEMRQGNFDSGVRGLTGALGALVSFTQRAAEAGSDLYETMNKVGQTFGNSQQAVIGLANEMAAKYGTVKNVTLDAAANFGLIGQAAGMTEAESAALAVSMTKLADDASSFFNKPMAESLEKLRSGLVGQARPLREYGVLLSKSAVDHELAAMGVQKFGREYTEAEKVMGRVEIIQRSLTKAMGDHDRTMGSYRNQMKRLQGDFENMTTAMGAGVASAEAQFLVNIRDKGIMAALSAHVGDVRKNLDNGGENAFQEGADVAAGVKRGGFAAAGVPVNAGAGGEREARLAAGTEAAAMKAIERANKEIAAQNQAEAKMDLSWQGWAKMFKDGARRMTEEAASIAEYEGAIGRSVEESLFLPEISPDQHVRDAAERRKRQAGEENEFMQGFLGLDTPAGKGGAGNIRDKMESFHAQSMGVAEFAAKLRMEQKGGDVPQKQLTELQQIRKAEMDQAKAMAKLAERGFPAVLA